MVLSSFAHLSPLDDWGKRTRKLEKKTVDSLYMLHRDISYCGYSVTEGPGRRSRVRTGYARS